MQNIIGKRVYVDKFDIRFRKKNSVWIIRLILHPNNPFLIYAAVVIGGYYLTQVPGGRVRTHWFINGVILTRYSRVYVFEFYDRYIIYGYAHVHIHERYWI